MWFLLVFLIILLAFLLTLFMVYPAKSTATQRAPFERLNAAHRGLHSADKSIPENSLAAFDAAASAGYGIEFDIQLSADSQVVVFHDDDLLRVCGVDGRVDSFTYEQLKEMPLHATEQRIPLFTQMLSLINKRVPLIVELKATPQYISLCEKAASILDSYQGPFCVESFDPRIVSWFKKNRPHWLRGQLASAPSGKGLADFFGGRLLGNFISRPHFIAYGKGKAPWLARFAQKRAMRVVWTVRPGDDLDTLQAQNDCLIFEFYNPPVHF